jgi:glutamyl-tRNA synthetase
VKRPLSREYVKQIVPLIRERFTTMEEVAELCMFFFADELEYNADLLVGKKLSKEDAVIGLKAALERLQALSFDARSLEDGLRPLAAGLGLKAGDFFSLLRVAVTGRTAAPPLFQTMETLGQERCLKRIEAALRKLQDKR